MLPDSTEDNDSVKAMVDNEQTEMNDESTIIQQEVDVFEKGTMSLKLLSYSGSVIDVMTEMTKIDGIDAEVAFNKLKSLPCTVLEGVSANTAMRVGAWLQNVGAKVDIVNEIEELEKSESDREQNELEEIKKETESDREQHEPEEIKEKEESLSYVDLGLPSGLKWAKCNLGASSPEEYGDYYAWGETSTKGKYLKDTYRYGASPKILPKSADTANVKLGNKWRMPTDSEWEELWEKCKWTWTTLSGVNGYKVVGPSGKSIFLPAAGYRYWSGFNNVGSCGNYWSSSLNSKYKSYAWGVSFDSNEVYRLNYYRYNGQSVRPVLD